MPPSEEVHALVIPILSLLINVEVGENDVLCIGIFEKSLSMENGLYNSSFFIAPWLLRVEQPIMRKYPLLTSSSRKLLFDHRIPFPPPASSMFYPLTVDRP